MFHCYQRITLCVYEEKISVHCNLWTRLLTQCIESANAPENGRCCKAKIIISVSFLKAQWKLSLLLSSIVGDAWFCICSKMLCCRRHTGQADAVLNMLTSLCGGAVAGQNINKMTVLIEWDSNSFSTNKAFKWADCSCWNNNALVLSIKASAGGSIMCVVWTQHWCLFLPKYSSWLVNLEGHAEEIWPPSYLIYTSVN